MMLTAVGYRVRIGMAMPFAARIARQNTAPEAERIRDVPDCADHNLPWSDKNLHRQNSEGMKNEQDCKRVSAQKAQAGLRHCPNL